MTGGKEIDSTFKIIGKHCRKEAEDDLFVDVDGLQLDLFGDPILHKDWILESIS